MPDSTQAEVTIANAPKEHIALQDSARAFRLYSFPTGRERRMFGIHHKLIQPEDGEGVPSAPEAQKALEEAEVHTRKKLAAIGIEGEDALTVYDSIYQALEQGEVATLQHFRQVSNEALAQRPQIPSTKKRYSHIFHFGERSYTVYNPPRRAFHARLVEEALAKAPFHIDSEKPPTFILMGGPPGVGKSTVRNFLATQESPSSSDQTEFVRTDPDLLRPLLMTRGEYKGSNEHVVATHDEAFHVSDHIVDNAFDQKKSFIAEGSWRNEDWTLWIIQEALERGYDVQLGFVHAPLAECFRRSIAEREDRAVELETLLSTVKGYQTLTKVIAFVRQYHEEHPQPEVQERLGITVFDTTGETPQSINPLDPTAEFGRILHEVEPLLRAFGGDSNE